MLAVTWISGAIFAVYILAFFGGMALKGEGQRWNESLPGLHDPFAPSATIAIGLHFVAGGVLLLLGPVQLIGPVRRRFPAFHRWLGRTYVFSAGLAGLGGLGFIIGKGTIGGPVMDLGFGLYGVLMILCAAMTYACARSGCYEEHRAWAIRLFALTVGSWLYRMEYGVWFVLTGGRGVDGFSGWFDMMMTFFFYVPNLLVAELFIRSRRYHRGAAGALGTAIVLLVASGFIMFATWRFTVHNWGPKTVQGITQPSL